MDYKSSLKYLNDLKRFGSKPGLERIKLLLDKMGNPQTSLKVIHVAGTNGKGSVCALASSILMEAGYKTGLYTSPHLIDFNERMQINGKNISEKELTALVDEIVPVADAVAVELNQPTFFEVLTALAFKYFSEKKVDYLVLEVGLGGRLDATNVVKPLVSVITKIGLEHTKELGDNIESITSEKTGIIKTGVPVVTAINNNLPLITAICKEKKSLLFIIGGKYLGKMKLLGEFQKENAALAIEAVRKLELGIEKKVVEKALGKVMLAGRLDMQKIKGKRMLFDCAHNSSGMEALLYELPNFDYDNLIVVAGMLKDKNYKKMLKMISEFADTLVLTRPENENALNPEDLAKFVEGAALTDSIGDAVELAKKTAKKNDLILITGSHYLVGPALKII